MMTREEFHNRVATNPNDHLLHVWTIGKLPEDRDEVSDMIWRGLGVALSYCGKAEGIDAIPCSFSLFSERLNGEDFLMVAVEFEDPLCL